VSDREGTEREEPALRGLAERSNADLLAVLDEVLLELERRLLRYARSGGQIIAMADEGLVLSMRAAARLRQAQSSAAHTTSHLQVLGVGGWAPRSTNPSWGDDPRVMDVREPGPTDPE
jgi:hypothetical protein